MFARDVFMRMVLITFAAAGLAVTVFVFGKPGRYETVSACQIAERWYEGFHSMENEYDNFEDFLSSGFRIDTSFSDSPFSVGDNFGVATRRTDGEVRIFDLEIQTHSGFSILGRLSGTTEEWENHDEIICGGHRIEDHE